MDTISLVLVLALQGLPAVQSPVALQALAASQSAANAPDSLQTETSLLTPAQITAVPAELENFSREAITFQAGSPEERLERYVDLVFGKNGLALEYDSHTRTIAESIRDHKANCLSFALIFMTLARKAGFDAHIQETDQVVAWYESNALYSYGHVNVGVKLGHTRRTVDIDSSVLMTSGKPRVISDERAMAHFYNNRGAELMEVGQITAARKHLQTALDLAPDFLPAWNNLGVLEMRAGSLRAAEKDYLKVTASDSKNLAALSNLANLYQKAGNHARQHDVEKRLFNVRRKDPFYQVVQALDYEHSGDYAQAVDHYQRAIHLMGKDHHLYFGLARAYAHLGEIDRAKNALIKARDASGQDQKKLYQAKLDGLQSHTAY